MTMLDNSDDKSIMHDLIVKLQQGCENQSTRYHFNSPATTKSIEQLERTLKLRLPASYKTFLLAFNGGFICDEEVGGEDGMRLEDAAWNSNFLHGLDDIEAAFGRKTGKWKRDDSKGLYIPFCSTDSQETLVFRNPLDANNESPVIDAWHEAPPVEWEEIYKNFAELLKDYAANEGKITTIG